MGRGHRVTIVAGIDTGLITPAKIQAAITAILNTLALTAVGVMVNRTTSHGPVWYQALEEGYFNVRLRGSTILVDLQIDRSVGLASAYSYLRNQLGLVNERVIEDLADL